MLDDAATSGGVGRVTDGPWGVTLAAFALQRRSGELVLRAEDGKDYRVAFLGGVVVAASSPLAVDSVARIALTSHMVTSSQISAISKRLAASSDRDEVDVVAEIAKLPIEHAMKLRRRVITQRAARTFAVDRGDYWFREQMTLRALTGVDVDICGAIYLGVHMNLPEARLAEDLRRIGARFQLHAKADVTRFGFSPAELAIVESLRAGATLPELDARHRDIVPRTQQAIVYAVVACGAAAVVEATPAIELAPAGTPGSGRVTTKSGPPGHNGPRPAEDVARARTQQDLRPRPRTQSVREIVRQSAETIARARTDSVQPQRARTSSTDAEFSPRPRTQSGSPTIPRTLTPRRNVFAVRDTIIAGIAMLDAGVDHYTLLGVDRSARLDAIRSAYVARASQLHKDKLPALDPDSTLEANRLFAAVNVAFGVLCDPVKRAEYTALLGKQGDPVQRDAQREVQVDNATLADVAFRRGLAALKRDDVTEAILELARAYELQPNDVDYAAALAWAKFCASSDKHAIAPEVRRVLQAAIYKSPKPMAARFYLGRVERMLGRVREALHHFREVLELEPTHTDAATEIRLLEPRAARR